jgi:cytochrome c oxidase subunit II
MPRAILPLTAIVLLLGAGIVWLAYGAGTATAVLVDAPGSVAEVRIRVQAWDFSPRVIRVARGQTIRLVAVSDDIRHGLAINELGVNLALLPGRPVASAPVMVDLPDGIYAIHCTVFCGLGHASMKARLVVGTPPRPPGTWAPWIASALALAAVGVFAILARARDDGGS